jgi:anaerobic ribonucleoside-triphosphate reductase activating protein
VSVLLREVADAGVDIEGVSVLGGEPFDQAKGLAPFMRGVQAMGLGVIVFTGFTREELAGSGDAAVAEVLAATDLLVDGRFEAARPEKLRMWVGSTNQRFHYLTPRYTAAIEDGPEGRPADRIEIQIDAEGRVHRNGWPLASPRGG